MDFRKDKLRIWFLVPPDTLKHTLIVQYYDMFLLERLFDKIRSGLLEQNILEHMFAL